MDIARITRAAHAAMAHWRPDEGREPGHPFHHGRRTAHVALHLADLVEADGPVERDVLYTAALFHDVGKGEKKHNEAGARIAREAMDTLCTPQEIDLVCDIILHHCHRKQPNDYFIELQIVQDADVLDHVGAPGLWQGLYHGFTNAETMEERLRYVHGQEYASNLEWMRSALNLDAAVPIYDRRLAFERAVYAEIERSHRGEL